jgi:hypothetical protein
MERDLVDVVDFGWASIFGHKKLQHYKGRETRRTHIVHDKNISMLSCRMASVKAFINTK